MQKAKPQRITTQKLAEILRGTKLTLDCGHSCTIGHNLSNTLVIISTGGGKIETVCHNCYS